MAKVQQGAVWPVRGSTQEAILDLIKQGLSNGGFDAALVPAGTPEGTSFAYVLIDDPSHVDGLSPLPPIVPVQGAKAIAAMTGQGWPGQRVAAFVRPCEARATVELAKLGQVALDNVILITLDCPGVLPLSRYFENPAQGDEVFQAAYRDWDTEPMRPVCNGCVNFSATGAEDVHIGTLGAADGSIYLMPNSPEGETVLDALGVSAGADVSGWRKEADALTARREEKRRGMHDALRAEIEGPANLVEVFGNCINCHNCMRVCPICYCRQCHFDSEKSAFPFEDYLARAKATCGLRFPPDTVLFHVGRMLHMSLSCVSCGMCEDGCPVDIPVAQIFSLVAERNQALFDYVPGRSRGEPLPLTTFEKQEFEAVEQSHAAAAPKQEA